jgi:hypothetical protein
MRSRTNTPALGMLYVGKDVVAQTGDRVMLSKEGGVWCQQQYPVSIWLWACTLPLVCSVSPRIVHIITVTIQRCQDWFSAFLGTITRVDKDGKMCDVKVRVTCLTK